MRNVVRSFIRCLAVAVVLAAGGLAVAQETNGPAEQAGKAADAVSKAIESGDGDALAELAAKDNPDAWNVTDVLLGRGRFDDALALAKACKGPDTETLAAYIESRKDKPYDTAARAACDNAQAALEAQNVAALRTALEGASSDGYLGARIQLYAALAQMMSGEMAEGAAAGNEAAGAAKALGWIKAEAGILVPVGNALARSGDMEGAVAAWERALTIQEKRKDVQGALGAVRGLAAVAGRSGDQLGSLGYMERLSAVAEAAGDDTMLAGILVDVGNTYGRLGKVEKARELLTRGLEKCEAIGRTDWAVNALTGLANLHQTAGELAESAAMFLRAGKLMKDAGSLAKAVEILVHAGNQQRDSGDLKGARETLLLARECAEQAGDKTAVASADSAIAMVDKTLGDLDAALARAEAALAVAEEAGDKRTLTSLVSTIGLIHDDRSNLPKAIEFLERALALCRETGDKAREAGALINLGIVHQKRAELARALELFEQGKSLAEQTGQRQFVANAFTNLANVYQQQGRLHAAREALEANLEITRSLGNPLSVANTLGFLGSLALTENDPGRALELLHEALAIEEQAGARLRIATSHSALAEVHRVLRDYEKARRHAEKAIEAFEAMESFADTHQPLNSLALVAIENGRYGEAFALQERAVETAAKAGLVSAQIAATLNLAGLQMRVGRREAALASHERVAELQKLAGSPRIRSGQLVDRGTILKELGRLDEAREALREGLAIAERLGRHSTVIAAHISLSHISTRAGDHDQAKAHAEKAVETAGEGVHPLTRARALAVLGAAYGGAGDAATAAKQFDGALEFAREAGALDVEASLVTNLARLRLEGGEFEKALALCRQAADLFPRVVAGLADEQSATAQEQWAHVQAIGVAAALQLDRPDDAHYLIERSRAGALLESLGGRAALAGATLPPDLAAEERRTRNDVLAARARMDAARASGKLKDVRATRKELEAAHSSAIAVVERIQRASKAMQATVDTPPAKIADIQSSLAASDALVSYALLPGGGLAALVITTDEARLIELADPTATVELPDGGSFRQDEVPRLRPILVEPLKLGKSIRRVLISSVGHVAYIPFSRLLGDRDVVNIPSATAYALLSKDLPEPGKGVLAIGDPIYDAKRDPGAVAMLRGGDLAPLPGTRDEVKAVATVPLLGAKATETGFAEAVAKSKRWRAVHFACHGLVDTERPLLSSLAITPDEQGDGFLTVGEILRTKIPADLVVLSACETGKGKVYTSEGVVGFTRAFLFAGSPRVIVSLWKVDDDATRALMTKFYELWKTKPAAKALREAQKFVAEQEKWSDPKYWAAWQLWGLP